MDHSHMDHSHMDHAGMDHGDGGHGGMAMCKMNMLFTWDTTNLCIVFRQWHVTGATSLVFSLLAIVAICAGYEALREATRKYELWLATKEASYSSRARHEDRYQDNDNSNNVEQGQEQAAETTPFLGIERIGSGAGTSSEAPIGQRARIVKAVLYGVQNFYAFMIMLLFMTYNGYVMIAVAVGAGLGYYLFGSHTRATKETACH
ncbi:Ctr copper transporter family-domain-containing protein [Nemania sp. FL0031]|nr:Ctr copper transporter family-domain-containing protein [Nemania sp. FL0031]